MLILRQSPYSVQIDNLIIVTVRAVNNKGASDASPINTEGALAQDRPQAAPVLARGALTSAT